MAQPTKEDLEQRAMDIRRERVAAYLSKGYRNYAEISRLINVPYTTVIRDVAYFRDKANENLQHWISNEIPMHLWESMRLYDSLMRECSTMLDNVNSGASDGNIKDPKLKLAIISTMRELQEGKTELMSNSMIAREILAKWKQKEDQLQKTIEESLADIDSSTDGTDIADDTAEEEKEVAAE